MRRRLTYLAVGCVLAGLLALGLFGFGGKSTSSIKLPATLPALEGGSPVALPKLGSSIGTPVVMTFFASWCAPCEAEMPALARFARSEKAEGVKLDFIGVDENDPSGGKAFAKKVGVDFPVGTDPYGIVLEDIGAPPALPQTIFINSEGVVVHHVYGSVTSGSTLQTWVHRITST